MLTVVDLGIMTRTVGLTHLVYLMLGALRLVSDPKVISSRACSFECVDTVKASRIVHL